MMIQSNEHKDYLRKRKRRNIEIQVARVLILITFFVLWEVLGNLKIIDPFLTSTPTRMFKSFLKIYGEGTLFKHIGITVYETILGFLLGTLLGTLIAIILWWSDFIFRVLEPYLVVLNALPKIALGPIIIFWVGNGMNIKLLLKNHN
jgi:NitT/TauT family transport system permease protein